MPAPIPSCALKRAPCGGPDIAWHAPENVDEYDGRLGRLDPPTPPAAHGESNAPPRFDHVASTVAGVHVDRLTGRRPAAA